MKFVKGDAIAGIIIIVINIVGGLIIGVMQKGMPLARGGCRQYSLLTIGDGLVAQIPALLISTAAGIIVTRAADESSLGIELTRQLGGDPKLLMLAGGLMMVLGVIPGLPTVPFFVIGSLILGIGAIGSRYQRRQHGGRGARTRAAAHHQRHAARDQGAAHPGGPAGGGVGLRPGAHGRPGPGRRPAGPGGRRAQAGGGQPRGCSCPTSGCGTTSPSARTSTSSSCGASRWAPTSCSRTATSPWTRAAWRRPCPASPTVEPAFGLPGLWISPADKQRAELIGYTVVDPASVLVAHLTEVIKDNAHQLLGRPGGQGHGGHGERDPPGPGGGAHAPAADRWARSRRSCRTCWPRACPSGTWC